MEYISNFMTSLYGVSVFFMFLIAITVKGLRSAGIAITALPIIFVFMVVLFGMRTIDTGTDTYAYWSWFESLDDKWTTRDFEPLFTIIGRTISVFTDSPSVFFSIVTILTVIFLAKAYTINNKIIVVPLAIVMSVSFISGVDLIANGIRNGLGLAIATFALLRYTTNGRLIVFMIYVSMASMIHASCVAFFVAPLVIKYLNTRYLKLTFYAYIAIFIAENFKLLDFVFIKLSDAGLGSHIIARILAFKYQESDMFNGWIKYYFFVISLIPYALYKFRYYVNNNIVTIHYIMLIPYAMIFSSPSSYRFSYMPFYLMVFILAQAVLYTNSRLKRISVYAMIIVMIFITYTTKTSLSYESILFT